jgi:methanethiol S-methyltransferase
MYPVLVFMYARLAKREEAEMLEQFGDAYRSYKERVPAFFPRLTEQRVDHEQSG